MSRHRQTKMRQNSCPIELDHGRYDGMREPGRRHSLPCLLPPELEPAESGFRLVLETVRRADRAAFSHAVASSSTPFVSFSVYPTQVVIECNDDAIFRGLCSTSNTAAEAAYTSKFLSSAFAVASSVLVETHNAVISLDQHGTGPTRMRLGSGATRLPLGYSRMTMTLRPLQGSTEAQVNLRSDMLQQLHEVGQICPLVLYQLRRLGVSFHDEAGAQVAFDNLEVEERGNVLTVRRDSKRGTVTARQTTWYHVKRSRVLVDSGRSVDVNLGFPLNADGSPRIQNEQVFATSSLGEHGFKVRSTIFTSHSADGCSFSRSPTLSWTGTTGRY
jgi:hypothetical protein